MANLRERERMRLKLTGKIYWSDCGDEGIRRSLLMSADSVRPDRSVLVWVIGRKAYELAEAEA